MLVFPHLQLSFIPFVLPLGADHEFVRTRTYGLGYSTHLGNVLLLGYLSLDHELSVSAPTGYGFYPSMQWLALRVYVVKSLSSCYSFNLPVFRTVISSSYGPL